MMGAPKRIFAWSVPPTAHLVGTWCVTSYPDAAQEYILATEHDRIVAEKDAEIARLRDALADAGIMRDAAERVSEWFCTKARHLEGHRINALRMAMIAYDRHMQPNPDAALENSDE
jgi:hypothetical protein